MNIIFQMAAQGQAWQKDAADQNFDYMFKLLVIGNSSVGKTSFLFRYADDSFTSAFVSTVGIDFKVKTVFRQDKRVKLQIWVSNLAINDIYMYEYYVRHDIENVFICHIDKTNTMQMDWILFLMGNLKYTDCILFTNFMP